MRNSLLVIAVLFSSISCQSSHVPQSPSKDLVIAAGIPIGEIKPLSSRSGIGANIVELLYRPLFRIGPGGEIRPELVREIRWEDREKTRLKVVLEKVSAQDVKQTVDQVRKLSGGDLAEGLKNLDSVQVVSENEVIFLLKRFDRAFLILLSQIPMVAFSEENPETGQFSLMAKSEGEVVLTRRERSSDKVNQIKILAIPSTRRAIRELVAGNVDLIFFARRNEYDVLADIPEIKIVLMDTRLLYQLLENRGGNDSKSLVNWRLAKNAIDFSLISKEIGINGNSGVEIPVPPQDPWYLISDNREKSEGGEGTVKHGQKARSISFLGEQGRDRLIARILKRNLESLGFTINLSDLKPAEFEVKIFRDRNFDLVLLPFNIKDTLISNYLVFHSPEGPQSLNFSGYSNGDVDKYLEEARYSPDEDMAKLAFRKAMESIRQDPPGLFLFWLKTPIVYRQSCTGFKFSSNEFFSSLKDVRCEPSAVN